MTRRAFLAAAFGTVTARALPAPQHVNYYISAPLTDSSDYLTPEMLKRTIAILSEYRSLTY